MSTDRELLELAAKAAGIEMKWNHGQPLRRDAVIGGELDVPWCPLTDDGDALRLAVKLGITDLALEVGRLVMNEGHQSDIYAATRRAIVRAAAEIGAKT